MTKTERIISAGLIAALVIYWVVRLGTSDTITSFMPVWQSSLFTLAIVVFLRNWRRLTS